MVERDVQRLDTTVRGEVDSVVEMLRYEGDTRGDCTERVDVDGVDCMMALAIGEMIERQ